MSESATAENRRSTRLFARIRVQVRGTDTQGRKFRQTAETIVINAHGGLLYVLESAALGSEMVLINPATEEEQECRVVYAGDVTSKGQRVGVEFLSPAPRFWGVEFAPSDWSTRPPVASSS